MNNLLRLKNINLKLWATVPISFEITGHNSYKYLFANVNINLKLWAIVPISFEITGHRWYKYLPM